MQARGNTVHLKYPDGFPDVNARQGLGVARTQGEVAHFALHAAEIAPMAAGDDALLENFI
jgi:hypothetical protein